MFEEFFECVEERANFNAFTYFSKGKLVSKTYGEFYCDVQKMRSVLPQEKKLLLFVPPSYALYVSILAGFANGNTLILTDDFNDKAVMQSVNCDFVLCNNLTRLLKPLCKIKAKTLNVEKGLKKNVQPCKDALNIRSGEPALITFTSGGSGEKKQIARSLSNLYDQFKFLQTLAGGLERDSKVLCMLAVYPLALLSLGCEIIPFFKNPSKRGNRKKLRKLCAVSSPDAAFGSVSRFAAMEGEASIKTAFMGGSMCHLSDAEKIRLKFNGAAFNIIYGASEAVAISRIELSEYIAHLKEGKICVGRIIDGIKVDFDNCEIMLSGETVSGGKHASGDLGKTENGKLFLLGRKSLSCSNKNLFNYEIETRLKNSYGEFLQVAFAYKNEKKYLIVRCSEKLVKSLKTEFPDFIIIKSKLPLDAKHGYKFDYKGLLNIISKSAL